MRVCNPALLFRNSGKMKRLKMTGVLLGVLLVGAMLMFYSWMIARAYVFLGEGEAIPRMVVTLASVFILIFTFFKSNGALFGGKDFDMILSLPVTSMQAAGVKYTFVYLMELLVCLIIGIPALAVYVFYLHAAGGDILCMIFMLLLTPLLPSVAALILGTAVLTLTSRLPFRQFFSLVINIAVLAGIMALSFGLEGKSSQDLEKLGLDMAAIMDRLYPLGSWAVAPLEGRGFLGFFGFAFLSVGCLFVFLAVVGKYYVPINSLVVSFKRSRAKRVKAGKTSTAFMALYKKEWKRLTSCTIYAMNTVVGFLLMIILGVAVFFLGDGTIQLMVGFPGIGEEVKLLLPFLLALLGGMTSTTAPSLSLEGKSRWIMCSIPVAPMTIFKAKIALHLSIAVPCVLISGICFWIRFRLSFWEGLWTLAVPLIYSIFSGCFGMYANVKFPRYDWTHEQQAVKNSMSVMVSVIVGIILGMVPFILFVIFLPYAFGIGAGFSAGVLLLAFLCYRSLGKVKLFE